MRLFSFVAILAVCLGTTANSLRGANAAPVDLRTEGLVNPITIDSRHPQLSWESKGTEPHAARIIVADTLLELSKDSGNVWDSGRRAGEGITNMAYGGKILVSGRCYFWKVKTWDGADIGSDWSHPAAWATGVLDPSEWKSKWISFADTTNRLTKSMVGRAMTPRYFRKDFSVRSRATQAYVFYSAIGLCELYLNGTRIGSAFDPGVPAAAGVAYYRGYDILPLLRGASNTIGAVVVGNMSLGKRASERPSWLVQIVITFDGEDRQIIPSDDSWMVSTDGPLRQAAFNLGEHYDARRHPTDWVRSGSRNNWTWDSAEVVDDYVNGDQDLYPRGLHQQIGMPKKLALKLVGNPSAAFSPVEEVNASSISEFKDGVYLFDLGTTIRGSVKLQTELPTGTKLTFRYLLKLDDHTETPIDSYICRGRGEEYWFSRFSLRDFRYIEVTGFPTKPPLRAISGISFRRASPR